jgi:hypothetical protein
MHESRGGRKRWALTSVYRLLQQTGRAFRKVESRPEQGSRAYSFAFVALSTESDAHDTHLVLPSPDTMRGFDYAIVDGFNNWGYSVPLEPSTRFGRAYAVEIRKWIDQIGEKLA